MSPNWKSLDSSHEDSTHGQGSRSCGGIIARKRVKKDGRTPKKLWHDLLTDYTNSFDGHSFFGGLEPNLVDFAAFGYMRSISPFKQFKLLEEHEMGMKWYRLMEQQLK